MFLTDKGHLWFICKWKNYKEKKSSKFGETCLSLDGIVVWSVCVSTELGMHPSHACAVKIYYHHHVRSFWVQRDVCVTKVELETWTGVVAWTHFPRADRRERPGRYWTENNVSGARGREGEGPLKARPHTQMWDILMSNLSPLNTIPSSQAQAAFDVWHRSSRFVYSENHLLRWDKGVADENIWKVRCEWRAPPLSLTAGTPRDRWRRATGPRGRR